MRKAHRMIHQLIEPFQPSFIDGYHAENEKLALLVRLRWVFILAQILLIYPAVQLDYLLIDRIPFYLGVNLALIAFNFWGHTFKSLFAQVSVDLLALCSLLVMTAGCHNPFSSLVFVSAILGPMFLSNRQSFAYLTMTAVGLTTVCLYTEPLLMNAMGHQVSPYLTITAKVIVLYMLGLLTLWLKACLDRSQQRFERLYKQRQRLNNFRAVGVVAGQLSHELSTPLNTLKLMIDKLERRPGAESFAELRMAKSALSQCERTVRNLFDCGVDAGSLSFKETEIADFIRSICEKWQKDFPDVKLLLEVDHAAESIQYNLPVTPFAQTVMDLLDNAMDASTDDHEVEINVAIASVSEGLNISISDKGTGLDEAIRDRIGQPFVSTKPAGTGLGLYNAQSLLEALGGSLGLSSRSGGGTRVQMVLPL
ncbi:MAG: HAMP domain-containing histidine kinase [Proteobacteria bacterium]|nr:MAG: HAMP domain-containing histidine kinase [Pseudomonadota bacterium]